MTAGRHLVPTLDPLEAAYSDAATPEGQPPASYYLRERYASDSGRSPAMRAYYAVKPAMPRALQIALRRLYSRRQRARTFPAWPAEPVLVDRLHETIRAELRRSGARALPMVGLWPEGKRFAFVLTHDVEGPAGVQNIRRVREVERRHGFVSSWNFCAEWYPIPPGLFDELRADGCEIGLHGITHDGKLFASRASFEADLPAIHRYLSLWGAEGFRSPATHRNAEWMPELGCRYDSSFPDTDPFEPQSGGCCSIFPYFLDGMVELPVTLVQDHTLWAILREESIDRWVEKSDWLIANHGLVNLILHPDYVLDPDRLDLYDQFLAYLAHQPDGWHALPRDVAAWWRTRSELRCVADGEGNPIVTGDGAERAAVAYAGEQGGPIVIEA